LARNEEIRARVAQINAARWSQERAAAAVAVERAAITKEALIAKAEEVRVQAMEKGQFSAAVAALKELGILTGLRIERSERGSPHEFSELSDADLLKELRQMGYRIEVDAPPTHGMN
jgi:hypothetical protein